MHPLGCSNLESPYTMNLSFQKVKRFFKNILIFLTCDGFFQKKRRKPAFVCFCFFMFFAFLATHSNQKFAPTPQENRFVTDSELVVIRLRR